MLRGSWPTGHPSGEVHVSVFPQVFKPASDILEQSILAIQQRYGVRVEEHPWRDPFDGLDLRGDDLLCFGVDQATGAEELDRYLHRNHGE